MLWFVNKTKEGTTKPVFTFYKNGVEVSNQDVARDFCSVMAESNKLQEYFKYGPIGATVTLLSRALGEKGTTEKFLSLCRERVSSILSGRHPAFYPEDKLKELLNDLKNFLEKNGYEIIEREVLVETPEYEILTDSGDILKANCYIDQETNTPKLFIEKSHYRISTWFTNDYEKVLVDDSRKLMEELWADCYDLSSRLREQNYKISVEKYINKLLKSERYLI